jgi:hypothetical protein
VKNLLLTTALITLMATSPALADPAAMVGLSFDFGRDDWSEGLGLTAKVLSSDEQDHIVGALGATWFPMDQQKPYGIDLSAGYTFDNTAVTAGYDFINMTPQVSAGWADTQDKKPAPVMISDRRLKRDITWLATLPGGLALWSFRYLWSDIIYVGVMAQDLLFSPAWRHAVIRQANGFHAVRYDVLRLRMATFDEWMRDGLHALKPTAALSIAA